jgi:hypothetical protein
LFLVLISDSHAWFDYIDRLSVDVRVFPASAKIKAMAVNLIDLPRSHGVVGNVSGFDHSALDRVQTRWAAHTYNYPLWMYNFQAVSPPIELLHLDYYSVASDQVAHVALPATHQATCNAVVFWVDFYSDREAHDASLVTSTGPLPIGQPNSFKQTIRFLADPITLGSEAATATLYALATFDRNTAAFKLDCRYE